MVGRGRATRHHQLDERDARRGREFVRPEPRPQRVERLQPGEQGLVDRGRMGPRQRLVEVVMGVDEAGQNDVAAGVEDRRGRKGLAAFRDEFDDPAVVDDDPALGPIGDDRQRILDPEPPVLDHSWVPSHVDSGSGPCKSRAAVHIRQPEARAPSRVASDRGAQNHHSPVFFIEPQGSAGSFAPPFWRSSSEMLSGVRTKAMWPSRGGLLMVTPASISVWQVA